MFKEKLNYAIVMLLFLNGLCQAKNNNVLLPHEKSGSINELSVQDWAEIKRKVIRDNSVDLNHTQSNSGIGTSDLSQSAYVKASNTDAFDGFGGGVAIWGNTVAIGAAREGSFATGINGVQSDNSLDRSGAVYVFVKSGGSWRQQAYIKPSNTDAVDTFGHELAIYGDTLVISADWEDSNANTINGDQSNNSAEDSGAVYVFVRDGETWQQQAYLKASNSEALDYFGRSVDIYEDTIVVGAIGEDSNASGVNGDQNNNSLSDSGAIYVFRRKGNIWTQQDYIKASNPDMDDEFGGAVSIYENTIVVGVSKEDSFGVGVGGSQTSNISPSSGAVYVFVSENGSWSQQAYINMALHKSPVS